MMPLIRPTQETAEAARTALRELRNVGRATPQIRSISIRSSGGEQVGVTLPDEVFAVLIEVLNQLANGVSVRIVPELAELTTQEASELLKVSRPFLIRLLESGEIPFRKTGTHRRVRVQDLMAYKERDDLDRRAAADELVAEAQEHDLGY